jgi:ion channel-forming bestrophin family protein
VAPLLEAIRRLFPPLRVWPKLGASMIVLALYGLLVWAAVVLEHLPHIDWGAESTILNGLGLGFLIAFRNHQAYDRWWEARSQWGQLVNNTRNFCMKLQALTALGTAEREAAGRLLIAFAPALLNHLRRPHGSDEDRSPSGGDIRPVHDPSRIAGQIYKTVASWVAAGRLDGWALLWLDPHIKALMEICGTCEKIRSTPLSSSYRALLRHGIAVYLLFAPFYLVEDTGPAGLPVFLVAAYFLLGIELVAEEIEEPFGRGGDNLPLERYCETIQSSVRTILGVDEPALDREPTGTRRPLGSSASRDPERD